MLCVIFRLIVVCATALGLTGCAQHLCVLQASSAINLKADAPEQVTTAQWMMLLLRGPSHTCLGQPIVPAGKPLQLPQREPQAPRHEILHSKSTVEHVFAFEGAGPNKHIVWLKTHEAGATQYGPIAVVSASGKTLAVEALGSLQALTGDMQLYTDFGALWAVAKQCQFHPLLLRHLCHEQLQVLPQVDRTFVSTFEAPYISLERQEAWALAGGWYRIKEQQVQCDVDTTGLILQETIAVKEVSATAPKLAPRQRRTASNRRTISYDRASGWTQSEPPLWPRMSNRH